MEERERIRMGKEARLPRPWSQDPVFQRTYFCNVNREDDRVTRWIRNYWNVQHPNYELAMCVARLINRIETLEDLGRVAWDYPEDWIRQRLRPVLHARAKEGKKNFGGAYLVSTHGQRMNKVEYVSDVLENAAKALGRTTLPGTLAGAHSAIQGLEGFGSFMAAQVVADLKNTAWHHLAEAPDWWSFSAHGPGSLRGLSWYFGEKVTPSQYPSRMQILMGDFSEMCAHNPFLRQYVKPILCMQNLQNCLCEYDKYMRVATGSGRSKRGYNGSH